MLVILNYPRFLELFACLLVLLFASLLTLLSMCSDFLYVQNVIKELKGIHVPMFQNLALCVKFVVANNIYIFAG